MLTSPNRRDALLVAQVQGPCRCAKTCDAPQLRDRSSLNELTPLARSLPQPAPANTGSLPTLSAVLQVTAPRALA